MSRSLEIKFEGVLMKDKKGKVWVSSPLLTSYKTEDIAKQAVDQGYQVGDRFKYTITIKPKE